MFRGHKTKLSDCFKVSERCPLTSVPPSYESVTLICSQSVLQHQHMLSSPSTDACMDGAFVSQRRSQHYCNNLYFILMFGIDLFKNQGFFFSLDMKQLKILHAEHLFRNFKLLLPLLNLLHLNRTFRLPALAGVISFEPLYSSVRLDTDYFLHFTVR